MATAVEVGRRVRQRRIELGWPLARLAELVGLSRQQVAKFETGVNRLAADQLAAVCKAMGVSADAMLGLQWVGGLPPTTTSQEDDEARRLLVMFRSLPPEDRRELMRAARMLSAEARPLAA